MLLRLLGANLFREKATPEIVAGSRELPLLGLRGLQWKGLRF